MQIEYLPYETETKDTEPLHPFGLMRGQGVDGYGRRITMNKKAKHNNRWYRVYCCCFSNVGSCWIETKGERLYLRG